MVAQSVPSVVADASRHDLMNRLDLNGSDNDVWSSVDIRRLEERFDVLW